MKKVFNPGFFVMLEGYDQGSSGGQIIVKPGNPTMSYYDSEHDRTYYFVYSEGWYSFNDTEGEVFVTADPEGLNVDGMDPLP